MSSKIIIIATIVLILIGFSVLFIVEAKNHNYDYKKAWSVVYFENPRDGSLDFAIENHEGAKGSYYYKILAGDDKVFESEIDIDAGRTQKISPVLESSQRENKKITVVVIYKDTVYKIYKDI